MYIILIVAIVFFIAYIFDKIKIAKKDKKDDSLEIQAEIMDDEDKKDG